MKKYIQKCQKDFQEFRRVFSSWQKNKKSKKAFTLIEMVAVVGIIAILVAIIQPKLEKARSQAKYAANDSNAKQLMNYLEEYYNDNGVYPVASNNHGIKDLLDGDLNPYVMQTPLDNNLDETTDKIFINPWTGTDYITNAAASALEAGQIMYYTTTDQNGYEIHVYGRAVTSGNATESLYKYRQYINRDTSTTTLDPEPASAQ